MKPIVFFSFLAIIFIHACKPSPGDNENINPDGIVLKDTISIETARRLVKNFDDRVYRKNDRLGFTDTRCIWFSAGQLDSLVQFVKKYQGDGIRFYLAAYDKDSAVNNNSNFRDHTTLVLVSTVAGDNGKHIDYFSVTTRNSEGVIITKDPENRGEICPPPANCIGEGAKLLQ